METGFESETSILFKMNIQDFEWNHFPPKWQMLELIMDVWLLVI